MTHTEPHSMSITHGVHSNLVAGSLPLTAASSLPTSVQLFVAGLITISVPLIHAPHRSQWISNLTLNISKIAV